MGIQRPVGRANACPFSLAKEWLQEPFRAAPGKSALVQVAFGACADPYNKQASPTSAVVFDPTWQRDGDVRDLIAGHVENLTALLGGLATRSRDFH